MNEADALARARDIVRRTLDGEFDPLLASRDLVQLKRWLPNAELPAWDDLESAADYIARDSEFYSASFVREVKDAAASLGEFAERGQIVPEFGDESIRELLVRPYRLVYEVSADKVLILALIHGARRLHRS